MLPTDIDTHSEVSSRQTNYLILRSLEAKLDPTLFKNLLSQVSSKFFSTFLDLHSNGAAWAYSMGRQATPLQLSVAERELSDVRLAFADTFG